MRPVANSTGRVVRSAPPPACVIVRRPLGPTSSPWSRTPTPLFPPGAVLRGLGGEHVVQHQVAQLDRRCAAARGNSLKPVTSPASCGCICCVCILPSCHERAEARTGAPAPTRFPPAPRSPAPRRVFLILAHRRCRRWKLPPKPRRVRSASRARGLGRRRSLVGAARGRAEAAELLTLMWICALAAQTSSAQVP